MLLYLMTYYYNNSTLLFNKLRSSFFEIFVIIIDFITTALAMAADF